MRWYALCFYCCFVTATSSALCETIITVNANEIRNVFEPLTQNTKLYNYGTITSDIITNGNNFDVYNYGTISGTINADCGFVNQHVDSVDAFHSVSLDSGSDLYIYINGVHDITLTDLMNLGNAENFDITNSSIVIDDLVAWNNWGQSAELDRTNTLIFSSPSVVQAGDVINHIGENLAVSVQGLDPASVPLLSSSYGSWIINFGPNPNYPLSNVLNSVNSIEDKNRIKHLSYHFNPNILMNPIKTINTFITSNIAMYKNALYSGLSGSYVVSDKTDAYGFDLSIKGKHDDVYLSAGFNFHDFSYQDDYNNFDGLMYGFNVGAKTYFDNLWLDGTLGLLFIDFDADNILYNDETRNDPFGMGLYGTVNLGYDYIVMPNLTVSPFVGTSVATYRVYDINDTDYHIRGGGKVEYSFVVDNIKYEYSGTGAISADGDLYGTLKVGFVSEIDNAGLALGFDVLKTDEETGYKISVSGNITF